MLIQHSWDWAQESAFKQGLQVILLQVVYSPDFEEPNYT